MGGTEAARGALFLKKVDDLFSRSPQNFSSPAAGSISLAYLRPTEHFWLRLID